MKSKILEIGQVADRDIFSTVISNLDKGLETSEEFLSLNDYTKGAALYKPEIFIRENVAELAVGDQVKFKGFNGVAKIIFKDNIKLILAWSAYRRETFFLDRITYDGDCLREVTQEEIMKSKLKVG